MNNGIAKIIIVVIIGFFIVKTCNLRNSSSVDPMTSRLENWEKSPVDDLLGRLSNEQNFSIILRDMDSRNGTYYHKYSIIVEHPDTVLSEETDWMKVSDAFFANNIDNMGMEIATKKDGKLSKVASPAGYNHYVGNEKYGHWVDRGGTSFWEFYGRYAFMSSMFNLMTFPVRRDYWYDYRGGYYGSRPYYGPSGRQVYGTKSYTSSGSGKSSTWSSRSSSFKSQIRSRVSRSPGSGSAQTRRSRSSSRYSSFSSRSRSGGFGK
jgi:hypothetical protein